MYNTSFKCAIIFAFLSFSFSFSLFLYIYIYMYIYIIYRKCSKSNEHALIKTLKIFPKSDSPLHLICKCKSKLSSPGFKFLQIRDFHNFTGYERFLKTSTLWVHFTVVQASSFNESLFSCPHQEHCSLLSELLLFL